MRITNAIAKELEKAPLTGIPIYESRTGAGMNFGKMAFFSLSAMALLAAMVPVSGGAQEADNAARFGALESIAGISLSPDGRQLAYIENAAGGKRRLFVVDTTEGAKPRAILSSGSTDSRLSWCNWVTNARLTCKTHARVNYAGDIYGASSVIAIDSDGGNLLTLSNKRNDRSLYTDLRGGSIIDRAPSDDGSVLMTRSYVPETDIGTNITKRLAGLGVDVVDTVTGLSRRVENPAPNATGYISDGYGRVRIMETAPPAGATGQYDPITRYYFRPQEGGDWRPLTQLEPVSRDGFQPAIVDAATNRVYGFKKINGRTGVAAMALDGTGDLTTIFARPDVDVDEMLPIGPHYRLAGVAFVTDRRQSVMVDKGVAAMSESLSKALGGRQVVFVDESMDESHYLILATSNVDPGTYYLFNARTKELRPLLMFREKLAGVALSAVKMVTYPAADGTPISAYLTLPPGRTDAKGLPAIVMPNGSANNRDEWGFDWLAQYFAQSGYAVLQPNFRGSSGYSSQQWFLKDGFRSWRAALGDVADGGRWLAAEGADAQKLSLVGWSFGGYAALQTGVLAPDLFKAIVTIAPVTDLARLKEFAADYGRSRTAQLYIGSGPHIREGSPAQNAGAINAPVLIFHGTMDQYVNIEQSRVMRGALKGKGKSVELVEYPDVGNNLESSEARTDMLRRISAFLPH
ncbi:alpha/beta hydrolase family protein [Sphingopyxis sp. Root154]|nr:alpha/beta fold hydrolase [Sphingopyxis sp. Root154]